MNKKLFALLLIPLLVSSCTPRSGGGGSQSSSSSEDEGEIIDVDPDEYGEWAKTWSQDGHLYFHYNRGDKKGYSNYCLWLWQYEPESLEGALWGFSADVHVSDKLTLRPMTTSFMTYEDVGKSSEGSGTFIDNYGIIFDVDLHASNLVGGKSGQPTTYEGATSLGFLLPRQDSMSGLTNWTSDGGREIYIEDVDDQSNWMALQGGGKALHVFVATGALDEYTFLPGEGEAEVKTNPIDEDTTGQYSSAVDTKYTNTLGNSSTAASFKELGVGYQVFVASFRRSNSEGKYGDLRGVIQALDEGFFDDLNVDVIWLTPIQKSDSYHGYDISDYYQVDKRFGTIEDYQELLYKAHNPGYNANRTRKIRVLMDLVLNHTSKSNKWFINSQWGVQEGGIKWRDVYTWKYENEYIDKWNGVTQSYDRITVKEDAESSNPSWYRDGESHYYYYGKFGSGMPEINYLNENTRKLVIDMAKYWMSFGLDGFRLDAVKHIFMRDECYQQGDVIIPDTGSKTSYNTDTGKTETRGFDYSSNVTKNVMWWKEFAHGVKNSYPDCFLVGENFDGWGTRTAPYYQALDSQFSFSHYYHIPAYLWAGGHAGSFKTQAAESYDTYASSSMFNLGDTGISVQGGGRSDFIDGAFTSNHDVMRAINQANGTGTAAGTTALNKVTGTAEQINKAKIHAAVTIFDQGISWIYYGDELGMSSNTDKHNDQDHYPEIGENNIDIWYRQPYLWHSESSRPNYKSGEFRFELDDYNKTLADYEAQKADANSMYSFYKELTRIKGLYPSSAKIEYHETTGDNTLVIKVTGIGKSLAIFINVGRTGESYSMNPSFVLGKSAVNVAALNGAPSTVGGDIGATPYGISVWQAE